MIRARISHATILALIGWYLMMPPMVADLRPECAYGGAIGSSTLILAMLEGVSPRKYLIARCHHWRHKVSAYAPITAWPDNDRMTLWPRIGQFDTLVACEAQYAANQTAPIDESFYRDTAASELVAEGRTSYTKNELENREAEIRKGFADQIAGERCIASDPNNAR